MIGLDRRDLISIKLIDRTGVQFPPSPPMIVKDLIEKLSKVDKNLIVILEGCDCISKANGTIYEGNKTLLVSSGNDVMDKLDKQSIDNSVIL